MLLAPAVDASVTVCRQQGSHSNERCRYCITFMTIIPTGAVCGTGRRIIHTYPSIFYYAEAAHKIVKKHIKS